MSTEWSAFISELFQNNIGMCELYLENVKICMTKQIHGIRLSVQLEVNNLTKQSYIILCIIDFYVSEGKWPQMANANHVLAPV